MRSLTSTLTLRLRLTLTNDTEDDVFGGGDEVTNRSWCVAVDVAADADAAVTIAVAATTIFLLSIIGRWWKGYPYCLNHTRMQRPGSK